MVPSFLALFAMQQGNQLLIKELRGLDELGIYSVGYSLGSVLGLAVSSFTTAWTPFFLAYTNRIPHAQQLFPRVLTYYVAGFGALTLLFFAWARPVVQLLLPEAYWESAGVIGFSALGQSLIGCFSILVAPLYFAKDVSAVSVMQIASAGLALAANWFLVHRWGYMGAAIGLPVGYALMCAFVHGYLRRHPDRYVRFNYDWKRIAGTASVFCLAAVMVVAPPVGSAEIPRALIATVLVAVIAFMVLPKQERRTLRAKAIRALRRQF
jgi:O-antigen/teichoic acid export membrane protein